RMSEGRSYAKAVDLGQVMVGGTVSEVIESRHPSFKAGDLVVGHDGWQGYAVSTGAGMRTLDPAQAPIGAALGVLGLPGPTAYFENVGGSVLDAVLRLVNPGARIPLCGLISQYNATEPVRGPDLRPVLVNRVSMRGFIVSDHTDRQADFLTEMTRWVREARVRYREDVVDGLERAPRALIGLLEGRNFGKVIVRVGPGPTRGGSDIVRRVWLPS